LATSTEEPAPFPEVILHQPDHVFEHRAIGKRLNEGDLGRVGIRGSVYGPGPLHKPHASDRRNTRSEWIELVLVPPDHRRAWDQGMCIRMDSIIERVEVADRLQIGELDSDLGRSPLVDARLRSCREREDVGKKY